MRPIINGEVKAIRESLTDRFHAVVGVGISKVEGAAVAVNQLLSLVLDVVGDVHEHEPGLG